MKKLLLTFLSVAAISCGGIEEKEYVVTVVGDNTEFPLTITTTKTDTVAIKREAKTLLVSNGYPVKMANQLKFNLN